LIADVDCAARNYLAENGLAEYFGHALGHGVGLEIHESPRIAQNNSAVLKEGMVITVEPAVYLPEKFGIRIEDMALVTKKGCKVLSDDIH
jgi:Xaa-Pro aminopeptidase